MAGNSEDTDPEETEAMEIDVGEVLPSMPKWPLNVNKSPELEKHAESSLPPSVFLRQVEGALFPVYVLNVRIVDIKPRQSEIQLVRGHCPYYSCNSTVTHVNWALAGPLKFGKLLRPYCPDCCQIRRKRYLNLYFYLELVVEDNLGQICKIISTRDAAVRFFGMTVYQFVTNSRRRQKIKGQLETLLEASSSSRSDPVPGFTFEARIIPVAQDSTEQVQFYMFGDNPPLFSLAKRCKS